MLAAALSDENAPEAREVFDEMARVFDGRLARGTVRP
jgi:hypothetical protein